MNKGGSTVTSRNADQAQPKRRPIGQLTPTHEEGRRHVEHLDGVDHLYPYSAHAVQIAPALLRQHVDAAELTAPGAVGLHPQEPLARLR